MSENNTRRQSTDTASDSQNDLQSSSLIEGTFDSFARRLKREQEAKRLRQADQDQQQKVRHKLLLRAMTTIRRALSETERIDLGNRFSFELEVSDWQGWPRVELLLVDSIAPEHRSHGFIVTAGDNDSFSYIRISNVKDETIDRMQIVDEASINRIPTLLKKTVREFLDDVTLYVLDPLAPEELLDVQTQGISLKDDWNVNSEVKLGGADVFSDDKWDRTSNRTDTTSELEPLSISLQTKGS